MHAQRNLMVDVLKGLGIISVIVSHVYRGGTDPLAVLYGKSPCGACPCFSWSRDTTCPDLKTTGNQVGRRLKELYPLPLLGSVLRAFFWVTRRKAFTVTDLILGKTALHLYYMFYYMVFALLCPLLYLLPRKVRIGTLFLCFSAILRLT